MRRQIGLVLMGVGIIFFTFSGGTDLLFSLFSNLRFGSVFVPSFNEHEISNVTTIQTASYEVYSGCIYDYAFILATKGKTEIEVPPNTEIVIPFAYFPFINKHNCGAPSWTIGQEYLTSVDRVVWYISNIESDRQTLKNNAKDVLYLISQNKLAMTIPQGQTNVFSLYVDGKKVDAMRDGALRWAFELPTDISNPPRFESGSFRLGSDWYGLHNYEIKFLDNKTVLSGTFYKEPNECTIPPGYALVTEDFKAGTTITKESFARPVVAFCNSYPLMKMDASGKTLNTYSVSELELLRKGGYVTVPAGEVWKIMYVAKVSDLTKACQPGEYVEQNGECQPLPAFEYYCSSGTYDTEKHACLVQAVTRCIEGSYNENTGMCEKLISPENVVAVCPEGSELKLLEDGTKVCIFKPTPICEKGVLTQDELGKQICAYFPEIVNLASGQQNIEIGAIPDELHVRTYTCPLTDGRMIYIETFAGGKQVNKYSFRYPPNFFCKVHPVLITTADGTTEKRSDIYERIVNGETLTIPQNETWTFFYVGYANQQLPLVCKEGALKISEEKIECVVQPGVVHVCSEGQFDPVRGLCVIQPESKAVCESGYYDAQQKICIWHPPLQAVCEKGLYNPDTKLCEWKPQTAIECVGSYDESRGVCTIIPKTIVKCEKGYYDEVADVCKYTPETKIICSTPYTYNPQTNMCEYKPSTKIVCEKGAWNELTQACEYAGEINYVCEKGSYDKASNTCIVKPPIYYKCEKGTYNKEKGVCEYAPVGEAVCSKGSYDPASDKCIYIPSEYVVCSGTYDESTGKCVVEMTPNYECVGEIVGNKCIIKPAVEVICPGESRWDADKKACIIEGKVSVVCPEGSTLEGDKCVSKKAVVVSYETMQIISGAVIIAGLVLFLKG